MDWALPGLSRWIGQSRFGQGRFLRQPGLGLRLLDLLAEWSERRRQRMTLCRMGEYDLSDIGLSRTDALEEAGKPFWRA